MTFKKQNSVGRILHPKHSSLGIQYPFRVNHRIKFHKKAEFYFFSVSLIISKICVQGVPGRVFWKRLEVDRIMNLQSAKKPKVARWDK